MTRISTGPSASRDLAGQRRQPVEVVGVGVEAGRLARRSPRPPPRAARASGWRSPPARPRAPAPRRSPRPMPLLAPITSAARPSMPRSTGASYRLRRGIGREWRATTSTSSWSTRRTRSTALHPAAAPCTPRASGARAPSPRPPRRPRSAAPATSRRPVAGPGPVLERGGKPDVHDAQREARGMAVKLRPPSGEETDILAVTAPASSSGPRRSSSSFCACASPIPRPASPTWRSSAPSSAPTPRPQTAIQATLERRASRQLRHLAYHSPHAFGLVGRDGEGHLGPLPVAARGRRGDDPRRRGARGRGRDYLREELERAAGARPRRLRARSSSSRAEGDPLDDPTAVWPDERELVVAGRLEITELVDDPEAGEPHRRLRPDAASSTASSPPTIRSSTPARGPTRSRPIAASAKTRPRPGLHLPPSIGRR